jgi:hypothetical protein
MYPWRATGGELPVRNEALPGRQRKVNSIRSVMMDEHAFEMRNLEHSLTPIQGLWTKDNTGASAVSQS